jgi:hypothetical protein
MRLHGHPLYIFEGANEKMFKSYCRIEKKLPLQPNNLIELTYNH